MVSRKTSRIIPDAPLLRVTPRERDRLPWRAAILAIAGLSLLGWGIIIGLIYLITEWLR
jgi:hypothetical protein